MGLPNSCGFTIILVVGDPMTKFGYFFPMKKDYDSKKVAEIMMQNIVKLYGMPKSIVSDRDKIFTSKFWRHLFKLQGTTSTMSSAHHPQSDGQTEVLNKCLEMYLREPPALTRVTCPPDAVDSNVSQQLSTRAHFIAQLQQNLHKVQQAMKFHADKRRVHMKFDVDNIVLVKLQPYRQMTGC
ncbi:putative retroelement pol polyprotein [Trifolium pratense]|uniref:Putative retroelement pol polyprotein n=1 Tax=Trifolium pratense TaxID=57577 RepID=A0A2K3MA87_TRIPR|nr:putative retroelement pol polyprotein [Trifolium pratense]